MKHATLGYPAPTFSELYYIDDFLVPPRLAFGSANAVIGNRITADVRSGNRFPDLAAYQE